MSAAARVEPAAPFPGQPYARKNLIGKIVHYNPVYSPGATAPIKPPCLAYRGCVIAVILDQHQPWEDTRFPLPVVRLGLLESTHELITREWHFAVLADEKHRNVCTAGAPPEFYVDDPEVERWTLSKAAG